MKVQPTTRQLIEMLYERLPELFDRVAQPAPVQGPVAWPIDEDAVNRIAEKQFVSYEVVQLIAREILATPPAAQRQWVGLTDEDMQECIKTADYNQGQYKRTPYWAHLSTAIEAKLKEKNT